MLLGDYAVTFFDTAGIRETEDKVEQAGIDKANEALAIADIVLYVHDNTIAMPNLHADFSEHISPDAKVIIVRNKIDLSNENNFTNSEREVYVSVKTGVGMRKLVEVICHHLNIVENEEDLIFSRQRHLEDLHKIMKSLKRVLSNIKKGAGLEIQAESLRLCLSGFDSLTGETTSDDVLGAVFSKFCIGK